MNYYDVMVVLFLIFLEGALSFDNAVVLALMVKHLPPESQKKALTYGIWGAFAFRFLSLFFITSIFKWVWIKRIGAAYLLYLAGKHFISRAISGEGETPRDASGYDFWRTIVCVELMDIAFSIDSIMASVSVSNNFIVVFLGGVLGIVMMRFAATFFVKLLERFPFIEHVAYALVGGLGARMIWVTR